MKINKTLSNWLTTKYLFVIRNEENFEESGHFSYTPSKILFFSFLAFVLIFVLGFLIASSIFNRPVFNSAREAEMYNKMVKLSLSLDSLTEELSKREIFVNDLRKVIGGDIENLKEQTEANDSTSNGKNKEVKNISKSIDIDKLDSIDVTLRQEFEGKTSGSSTLNASTGNEEFRNYYFFSPLKGIVSEKFDFKEGHYGIDVVSKKDEPIKSLADGTVIMASWTDDTGYVIAIQHRSDLISVYKHCSVLMKKIGNFVQAGEIIAIIGNTGKYTSGPHLHFELWYKGNPVDPEKFISF